MGGREGEGQMRLQKELLPRGPWDTEPDKEQWRTEAGLPGLLVRSGMGALCGYAAVPPGHPLHGQDYETVDTRLPEGVHGGLTYAAFCQEHGMICHEPEPGEPADVWWFGFDCAHAGDLVPAMSAGLRCRDDVYRDHGYVRAEVERLAMQLAALG